LSTTTGHAGCFLEREIWCHAVICGLELLEMHRFTAIILEFHSSLPRSSEVIQWMTNIHKP
jgi:hypothetical protein